jgi:hypothetical protein
VVYGYPQRAIEPLKAAETLQQRDRVVGQRMVMRVMFHQGDTAQYQAEPPYGSKGWAASRASQTLETSHVRRPAHLRHLNGRRHPGSFAIAHNTDRKAPRPASEIHWIIVTSNADGHREAGEGGGGAGCAAGAAALEPGGSRGHLIITRLHPHTLLSNGNAHYESLSAKELTKPYAITLVQ